MKPIMFGLRDWWSQWSLDRAGVESGRYRPRELRSLLEEGSIGARSWVRHLWTRKYALVGEVLYHNDLATKDEFDGWFPHPVFERPSQVAGQRS